ncbi:hypothetical protein LV457_08830 [Mycobacterium sp. MYCO198283]|uniref:Rv0361 family membrane protein n=1 Tax=Mycobacterium sp. MYCO198283 TaxID=2883505 RepID=UPI001E37BC8F|nr:hypothetical protein [Mycobacterium sp. MYCO198283]MCG5432398.1 hypothetical protein [Mycobacterium sp. MYCO198283]
MLSRIAGAAVVALAAGCAHPGAATSDAQQISAVVAAMEKAYDDSDWLAFGASVCAAQRLDFDDAFDPWLSRRRGSGPGEFDVQAVSVDGARAQATVALRFVNREFDTAFGADPVQWRFVREGGAWKWCL